MDVSNDLLEMLGGEPDSETVPADTAADGGLVVGDLRRLKIDSLEQAQELITRWREIDLPRMSSEAFAEHLLVNRNSWFVEAGDVGVIFFTEILPEFSAYLHVMFWDKTFDASRRATVQVVVRTAFERFNLKRISAVCPSRNQPYAGKLKKMGFLQEGTIRNADTDGSDIYLFGMLREELPWHVLPMPVSSLV